jgi:hypothetical protein
VTTELAVRDTAGSAGARANQARSEYRNGFQAFVKKWRLLKIGAGVPAGKAGNASLTRYGFAATLFTIITNDGNLT